MGVVKYGCNSGTGEGPVKIGVLYLWSNNI